MSRYNLDASANYANGAAGSVAAIELWIAQSRKATRNENFWGPFMKPGINAPIRYIPRPGSAGGSKVTLRIEGQLGGPGKKGGQRFAATSDFGTVPMAAQSITLDLVKQATGIDPHAEEMVGVSIAEGIPGQIGSWGAQYLERQTDMTIMHKSGSSSRIVANGKTVATLLSADTPSWSIIRNAGEFMKLLGGRPFMSGREANGRPIYNLMFQLVSPAVVALKDDPDYKDRVTTAGVRGAENGMFRGTVDMVDGHTIVTRDRAIPQGQLSAGTCWAPYALLGAANAYSAGGDYSAAPIRGGGNLYNASITDTPWFETFPGYPFPWDEANTLALASSVWGSGPYYALIVNPPSAATDPGKVGMIKYTVGTGANTLTIVERLTTASTTGSNVTTIGDSVTAAGLFAGRFTQEYQKGASIIPCNAKGTPIGAVPGLGADAIGFIRGNRWGELFNDQVEGGLSGKLQYSGWTFGQEPFVNNSGDTPGVVVILCALSYPHLNLPEVT